jgi:hypothetical protein
MSSLDVGTWSVDWAWSLPLIAITVVIHVFGLGLLTDEVGYFLSGLADRRRFAPIFALVMSITITLATILHAIEGAVWAGAYRLLGALPDNRSATLYSLGAMTTYGHENLALPHQWQMMGNLEALDGMLLFGLTTAFLFAMIQRVWPIGVLGRDRHQ